MEQKKFEVEPTSWTHEEVDKYLEPGTEVVASLPDPPYGCTRIYGFILRVDRSGPVDCVLVQPYAESEAPIWVRIDELDLFDEDT